MNKGVKINELIYGYLVFSAIFTDTIFSNFLGYFGRSLVNVTLPLVTLIYLFVNKEIVINQFLRRLMFLTIYLVMINIVADVVWICMGNGVYLHGNNIWIKSLQSTLYWAEIVVYMIVLYSSVQDFSIEEILRPFVFTFFFLFFILVIELMTMPYAFTNFHQISSEFYERVRLTTTESSTTVPLIIVYGFLSIFYSYYKKYYVLFVLILVMEVIFCYSSGSKTLLFCISICILNFGFNFIKNGRRELIPVYTALLIIGVVIVFLLANSFIDIMYGNMGSTYTIRTIPDIASVMTSLRNPFGYGGAVFYDSFLNNMRFLFSYFSNTDFGKAFSYWELSAMIDTSGDDVYVIAGFFNMIYQWGIVGALYLSYTTVSFVREMRSNKYLNVLLMSGLYCIIFMYTFTVSFSNYYMGFAYIIVLYVLSIKMSEESDFVSMVSR